VEGLQVGELGQVLLDDGGVVLLEHVVEILGYEGGEAGPGQSLVVEVEVEEGGGQGVESLPVDQVGVVHHPGLQHSLQLAVTLFGGQQLIILVTSRHLFRLTVLLRHCWEIKKFKTKGP
jgi:hypothetical protein